MRQHPLAFETIHKASGRQEGRLIKKNWKIVKAAAAKKEETVVGEYAYYGCEAVPKKGQEKCTCK